MKKHTKISWCKLTFAFLLKHFQANISPVKNVKTFQPAIFEVILWINTFEQNKVLREVGRLRQD